MTKLLDQIGPYAHSGEAFKPAPVELWQPDYCGDIDLRISRDGSWHYLGTPVGRPALVRLFASVLKRDHDGRFYLVTPHEKIGIAVEDAPFIAVRVDRAGTGTAQVIRIETNVGEAVTIDADHMLRIVTNPDSGEPSPYVHVRAGLEARLSRPAFYELVEWAVVERRGGRDRMGVWSAGLFFELADDVGQWT